MISYRHHIVTLVAVFFALAVGIALGGGPLSEVGRDDQAAAATTTDQPSIDAAADYGDEFAGAAAGTLYAGGLKDKTVAVVTLPGADAQAVKGLGEQVSSAGGKVAGTYALQPGMVEASEKSLVDTLGSQLMTQLGDTSVAADASTYDRMGQLLALGISANDGPADDATAIRQSLVSAELVTAPQTAPRASLVLVVLGDDTDEAIVSGLVAGLASKTTGVVVTGDTASGQDTGALAALRADPAAESVTTVDGDDTGLGRVTVGLALIRSLTDQGGSFGASGSDGSVPLT